MLDWLIRIVAEFGLPGLFVSGLLSATLLPGNSEIALAFVLYQRPYDWVPALICVTVGNTLGSLSSYWLGRYLRRFNPRATDHLSPRALALMKRYGVITLLLAWLPLIGDALCLAAGWLTLAKTPTALFIFLGKAIRYLLVGLPFIL
ncbi:YqaA family protein [Chitinimonas sp. PSY-7]|uniref:VTT domain-containing protein n=1 Tax=Chitinimonas sp. PSY-7 TaxID=3459088 RepID=UPI00403FF568